MMSYFNQETRVSYYEHGMKLPIEGLDHCYDCAAEIVVLEQYVREFARNAILGEEHEPFDERVDQTIQKLSQWMNTICYSNKTLATPTIHHDKEKVDDIIEQFENKCEVTEPKCEDEPKKGYCKNQTQKEMVSTQSSL